MGITLLYGLVAAVPSIVLAGPVFSSFLKKIPSQPLETFQPKQIDEKKLPGTANSIIVSLLPVLLLIASALFQYVFTGNSFAEQIISFIGNPSFVMLLCVLIAAYFLGIRTGKTIKEIMIIYGDAVKDIGMILLIIAGAGALKQVITDSGVTGQLTTAFQTWTINPLLLGWMMAAIIRVCVGSATIAGLTTAGIIAPIILQTHVNPNLMVLSIGAGSLMFSHVNDSGFWLFKEYFNVSMKNTFKTWTVMESIVSVTGLLTVLVLNIFIQ
jgi:Gnt-I system high-affinity gluconate transporter